MSPSERKRISKFLSLVLRHRPDRIGLSLDRAGWVAITELLSACRANGHPLTGEELAEVVATNEKRRFELNHDGTRIRASQGHSVDIDLGYSPACPPQVLYHGTARTTLSRIREHGLVKGRRHHVHLSPDRDTAGRVGQRHGAPIVLGVCTGRMHEDGFTFYLSTNGVWLTDHVPPRYLEFPETK